LINTLAPGWIRVFLEKKRLNARGFVREDLRSCTGYGPGRSVKKRGKSSSLKKNPHHPTTKFFVCAIY